MSTPETPLSDEAVLGGIMVHYFPRKIMEASRRASRREDQRWDRFPNSRTYLGTRLKRFARAPYAERVETLALVEGLTRLVNSSSI